MNILYSKKGGKINALRAFWALAAFFCLFPVYAQTRDPININLIIDGSEALLEVREDVNAWISRRIDQLVADGDRVTVWNAGAAARVVYEGTVSGSTGREAVKRSIREISVSGNSADFAGALREAAGLAQGRGQSSGFSYTLLICADPSGLSSTISGPQSNLLRFSRVEEFCNWRAVVLGLNLDSRVRRAASAFMGS